MVLGNGSGSPPVILSRAYPTLLGSLTLHGEMGGCRLGFFLLLLSFFIFFLFFQLFRSFFLFLFLLHVYLFCFICFLLFFPPYSARLIFLAELGVTDIP